MHNLHLFRLIESVFSNISWKVTFLCLLYSFNPTAWRHPLLKVLETGTKVLPKAQWKLLESHYTWGFK